MLVKDIMEVMAEDRAEDHFVLYWSWILHNFIHTLNTSRVPALHCVVTYEGRKCPATRYMLFSTPDDDQLIYCLTHPTRFRDLRQFCRERPFLKFSCTRNGASEILAESMRYRLGIDSGGWLPCDKWFINATWPITQKRVFSRPEHPWEAKEVRVDYDNEGLSRLPTAVESFDNEVFEGYLRGDEPTLSRVDMDPRNSVYFRKTPHKEEPVNTLTPWMPLKPRPLPYRDDDMSNVLVIE